MLQFKFENQIPFESGRTILSLCALYMGREFVTAIYVNIVNVNIVVSMLITILFRCDREM